MGTILLFPQASFIFHSKGKNQINSNKAWICYGFWPRAGPAVAMIEELARLLPSVISVVPGAAGNMPWGNKCLLVRDSRVWMMVLLSSMTEGTLPRVSRAPTAWPLVRLTFSPLCPRARSPFMAVSVEVSITVLDVVCKTGPTLECTRLQGGLELLAGVVVAKVTAPIGAAAEEDTAVVWIAVDFSGTEAASAMTDFVSAESLASDITYRVFMGLVVVTAEKRDMMGFSFGSSILQHLNKISQPASMLAAPCFHFSTTLFVDIQKKCTPLFTAA